MQQIERYYDVDRTQFEHEISPRHRPAVLCGLVADWPAARAARKGLAEMRDYLERFDAGRDCAFILAPETAAGRFFYSPDMAGMNFESARAPFRNVVAELAEAAGRTSGPAIAIQAAMIDETLPGFEAANRLPLLDSAVRPRLWLGTAAQVVAHFDPNENIACVVAGRRRFTLFPPEQTGNLYPGPFDFTPGGAPVSMVDIDQPDFDRHPRYADAQGAALIAELDPGDALYIPYLWWHQVVALDRFNMLVNYWWNDAPNTAGSPFDVLLHAMLGLHTLPPNQRAAWQALFDHYVFGEDDPLAHLPSAHRGLLGASDEAARRRIASIVSAAAARLAQR